MAYLFSFDHSILIYLLFIFIAELVYGVSSRIELGSKLVAKDGQSWVSENGTFAFGFTKAESEDQYLLAIWFSQLPGDRVLVWSANRNNPVGKNASVQLTPAGNLLLVNSDGSNVWATNTSSADMAVMSESGNFILYNSEQMIVWQSFSHPSDTLLPGQPLMVSVELETLNSLPQAGFYTLKMLQQPTSVSLGLSYNLPQLNENYSSNYSYWSGPEISNVTGNVVAILNQFGSFGIVYGFDSDGAVYLYKNDDDNGGLSSSVNQSNSPSVLRRLTLENNGNLRLYRWDNDFNGSRQWVSEWAAVSNPCDIAGICGNGVCDLDKAKTNSSCSCLPGSVRTGNENIQCYLNSSFTGKCGPKNENLTSQFKIQAVQQTNYYYSEKSVIANYSDVDTISKCGDACLTDCECVASVYGLNEEKPYCWTLKRLQFGGFQDPGSTLFVKIVGDGNNGDQSHDSSEKRVDTNRNKVVVIPIVLSMTLLIGLLCCLLFLSVHRRRYLKRTFENSLLVLGAPVNFSYRDLQTKTSNFSQLLGTGGFGSVYKGNLGDGTLIAVKKLDRVLPHGEKEFITEVNTIGSMHHMNLVRLCGYCSEGSQRLLVYEYMQNGSLDKWIFPSFNNRDNLLDWSTRFQIALETAQGIAYFHEQCRDRIIHCDIKPENILLDENFRPKVSDFGLAKLIGREHSQVVTMIRGTRGYLAPEWVSNRPITVKADVYSYGMLLLEIIGGRRNLDMNFDTQDFFYPGWAFKIVGGRRNLDMNFDTQDFFYPGWDFKEMVNGTPKRVVDRRLQGLVEEEELTRALKVAFWCIQDEVAMRPLMGEVVKMLEGSDEYINTPPMPQTVLELVEEGSDQVYKAMKRDINQTCSFTVTSEPSSHATCSHSTMSPR